MEGVDCMRKIMAVLMVIILSLCSTSIYGYEYNDVEICEELGILKGSGEGVTDVYLQEKTTRIQAAILFLRIKGLEEEALSYVSFESFNDMQEVQWQGGRAIVTYLYNHPELGWIGDANGNFKPYETINVQSYYKVLLELLGYKQGDDFQWDNTLKFADNRGLTVGRYYTVLTNDLFARMTVEGLRAEHKNEQIMAEVLTDEGIIESFDAVRLGLMRFPANEYYEITFEVEDENATLISDGVSRTNIIATVRRKVDGMIMGIYGEMSFNINKGTTDAPSAMIINGQAVITVTSEYSGDVIIAGLEAEVIEAGEQNEFLQLVGTTQLTYDPQEPIEGGNYAKVSITEVYASTADRLYIKYSGPISATAYKESILQQTYNIDEWSTIVRAGTNGGLMMDGFPVFVKDINQVQSDTLEFILETDMEGSELAYADIVEASWIPTQRYNILKDNAGHTLSLPVDIGEIVNKTDGEVFYLRDTISPELLRANITGTRTIVVELSEAITHSSVEMTSRGSEDTKRGTVFTLGMAGTKNIFRIDDKYLYLTNSQLGATQDEIAFAIDHNLLLVNELYVGAYDHETDEDHRNEVVIVLDQYSAMLQGSHTLFAHNILDWAGRSDPTNVMLSDTVNFYVYE